MFFRILIRCTSTAKSGFVHQWNSIHSQQTKHKHKGHYYRGIVWQNDPSMYTNTALPLYMFRKSARTEMKPDIRQPVLYLIHKHSWGQTRPCSLSPQTRKKCSLHLSLTFNEVWWIDFLMIKTPWNGLTTQLLQQQQTKFSDPWWASIDRRKWLITSVLIIQGFINFPVRFRSKWELAYTLCRLFALYIFCADLWGIFV